MQLRVVAALAAVLIGTSTLLADPRPFTFSYDTYPEGKGNWEYEQWITWRTNTNEDSDYQRVDFRHEFEFGLADNFDLGVYVSNWRWEDSADLQGTHWDSAGVEGIVYLSNPVTDFVGIGLYGEVLVGEDELEFEQKLLVHKDINNWTFAYNLIFETEIEGVFKDTETTDVEVEGVLANTFGASYNFDRGLRAGGELLIESIYADWSEHEDTAVYGGPVLSYSSGTNWWFTVTPMFQLSDVDGEANFMVRMIAGLEF